MENDQAHDPTHVHARTHYLRHALDERDASEGPFALFKRWLGDAEAEGLVDHNAMTLATTGSVSISCRMVLLRSFDARGFVFYTNYNSRKAMDLERDPRAALLFFWPSLERQVRIEGRAVPVSAAESDAYWATRPAEHRIGAWSSDQSRVVPDRAAMEERYARWKERFNEADVPRPEHWGGYRVVPVRFEFWQGRQDRMHDRIAFEHFTDGWQRMRLQP
jgi:pyridoxamine 5'-phosphate oxidase